VQRPSNGFRDTILYVASAVAIAGIIGSVKMYADQRVAQQKLEDLSARVGGCENTAADLVRQLQEQWRDLEQHKAEGRRQ
jgi:hypothetical protein